MNDLRLILLGIGFFIIALIYFWDTFKQKSQNRSHTRKLTSFERDSFKDTRSLPTYDEDDEVSAETLAELGEFLSNPKLPDIDTSNFSLRAKTTEFDQQDISQQRISNSKSITEESVAKSIDANSHGRHPQRAEKDNSSKIDSADQIITFFIKPPSDKLFSGVDILSATESVGLKFGDMNIFHHYGMEGLETDQAIFSMASMYEPGYFELGNMDVFQTKGLVLFMQIPAPIDAMTALLFMQETAMGLAEFLHGEIYSFDHKPIDENTLRTMRDKANGIA
ncbi:MAG: cell division protein ZipA [Gammaproteobacteria bacterium]|jgi:cell division protein ZipA